MNNVIKMNLINKIEKIKSPSIYILILILILISHGVVNDEKLYII